jgi:hypothetical protein
MNHPKRPSPAPADAVPANGDGRHDEPPPETFAQYMHRNLRQACEAAAGPLRAGQLGALILHCEQRADGSVGIGAQLLLGAPKDLAAELRRIAEQLDPANAKPRLWMPS